MNQKKIMDIQFFEWIPGIPITDKDNATQNKDDAIASTHEDDDNDDITENG